MEPEPSLTALLEAITALTATVGSLQDQIKSQSQELIQLKAICKETADLLGDKDQGGVQTQPGPSTGPITPPTQTGGEAHSPATVRPGLKAPFRPSRGTGYDSEEEEDRQPPKREPRDTPKRSLSSLTPFDTGSSVKRPKMELPDPYKGDTRGRKATQWLDRMLLWVALHRDQFDEEEQMVVWILYHMTDKAADWALPLIGTIIKGEGNPPTTITALTAKFKEAFADPNAKRAAARKIAALTQPTTTAENSCPPKDNIPDDDLEAIFAASIKIDNIRRENKENRPKKAPAKTPVATTTSTSTTTTRVRLSKDPNYVTPEERDRRRASGLCVKCGQKGHGIKQCPNGTVTFPEQAQIASEEEADLDPLADLPSQYHEFAKVFGEEEFKHIDEELATGKIRPSTLSAGAPVIKLNDVTHKNVYPLPRQDNLMAKLRHAKLFTKLDLQWGYNNVRIKEGDKWKTAFRTKYGLFEYLVMPFGLTNAPAAFQHFMNNLFRDLIDVTVVIYLDNILIFSENPEDHPAHVREVLSQLMKNQLFCKLSKCHFHVTTVDYLGIVISPSGFSMDQKKVEAVTSWPQPRTVKQVQAFLGFETPWSWGDPEEAAFQELKTLVTRSPVLIHSNPELPYYLETDASGVAMGAILSQRGPDNRLHPIAYMSKSFSGAEVNYNTHDKELLAIIKALEEWRIFLEATDKPVQVFTDHRNLEYWMQARTFNRRHARWRVFLGDFNFEIHYRPGKQSGKPDALSRQSDYVDTPPEPEVAPHRGLCQYIRRRTGNCHGNTLQAKGRSILEPIIQFLTEDADNAPPSIRKAYRDYNWEEDLLWYRGKLVVPDSEALKEQLLREFHDSPLAGHPGQQRTLELLSRNYWWPGMKSSAKEWVECCPTCQANCRVHAPVIALKPLEVPPFLFHTISYNFITVFPKSQGHDAILVVIDSFSKFGHFIPTSKKVTAKGLADLFITHVWKLHGLPVKTISDRGTTFTGKFLRALYQRLGVKPAFSSAYHPKSDGQTERVNQFIEFYLRSYVAADHLDWATWLPLAEYAYNNAKHAATGKTPFELVYGQNPVMNPSNIPANVPEADAVADTLAQEWREAESALRMSKERMTRDKGIIPEYTVGKKVWLDGKNVELRTNSNKLDPKRLGPFKITEKVSSHAYRLELPETLKIHNVFYVGLLSRSHESPSQPFPERPPPETIEGEEEYEVEQIIDSKRQRGKWFYLIKWKGYGPEDNSWEPEELLKNSQEEIQRFNRSRLKKACDSAKSL
ncbi:hypothetical protein RHS01_00172 [Rhizoctonia solani]|uniref:Uncharacterized protein n=1 Tax=Rhizoctonia solani TaxID=456999 RepID=A0A8H7IM85_9AGAM|nr:hypothetical protein RHS01_00172 [Rhizoctonia solani]